MVGPGKSMVRLCGGAHRHKTLSRTRHRSINVSSKRGMRSSERCRKMEREKVQETSQELQVSPQGDQEKRVGGTRRRGSAAHIQDERTHQHMGSDNTT